MIDVSIIIVNWNTNKVTLECLDSIYAQPSKINFEIILIDNNSSDNSVESISTHYPDVILIANKDNIGFAGANNQGMKIAQGRYLLLLNSDTLVLDNAIDKVVTFADKNPYAGIVGCKVLNSDRSLQPTCSMFGSILNWLIFISFLYKIFPRSQFWGREQMTWWSRDDTREVDIVTGCFMLVRKTAFEIVGGMDASFFMYCEEIDWCWRFKKAGWPCLFTPEAEIIHHGGVSAARYGAKRAQIKDRSTVKLFFKLWPRWKAYIGLGLLCTFYISRIVLLAPLALNQKFRPVLANHFSGLWGIIKTRGYKQER